MVFKKEVRISSKRSIKGKIAQRIGLIFLAPAILSYLLRLIPESPLSVILAYITLAGYGVAIISILYFVFLYKSTNEDVKIPE